MLFVLGDVSARGSYLARSKWSSVVQQFQRTLGPFNSHPFHVLLGDRDVGECSKLNPISVRRMARSFPGSDSAGCGAFEVSNISFVSLNAVALLCGNTELRFKVETVIERESIDLQMETGSTREMMTCPNELRENFLSFGWRENAVSAGSGPVVLLHFPLHRKEVSSFVEGNPPKRSSKTSWQISRRLESRFVHFVVHHTHRDQKLLMSLLLLSQIAYCYFYYYQRMKNESREKRALKICVLDLSTC